MATLEENDVNDVNDFQFEFVSKVLENDGEKIYNVSFFDYGDDSNNNIFATVSSNHATIYELNKINGKISCLQTYLDEAWDESLYCSIFSVDKTTSAPLLIVGGELGVIKVINCNTKKIKRTLLGHGYRINYLLNHPMDNNIIISCSDDQSLRIWNIESGHCLSIIAGHEGHRAAVLSADIHENGKLLISCGHDHAIKIWQLNDIKQWIDDSYKVSTNHENIKSRDENKENKENKENDMISTKMIQFPIYCRQKIHTNYVDHIGWFNDMIFSKSTESLIKIWMPPLDDFEKSIKTMAELRYKNGGSYFMRFHIDYINNLIAIGTINGKIYIFELDKYFNSNTMTLQHNDINDDNNDNNDKLEHWHTLLKPKFIAKYKPIILDVPQCNAPIRCVKFNRMGDLIAVSDNSTIYRYKNIMK